MTYKALIVDLDGTVGAIGTDGSDISEHDREAVQLAQQRGKRVSCATGRGWPKTKPVVQRLGFVDPCIIEGGSCIIDPKTEKVLWEVSLNQTQTNDILAIIKDLSTDRVLTKTTTDHSLLPVVQLTDPNGPNRIIYLLGVDTPTADAVMSKINETGFAIAHKTAPSWYGPDLTDVHVTNPEGTKEHAIAKWQKMIGVTKEETIGLGDSENDLPLFRSVGLKVAVGNAHDNLKAQADQVVEAYDNGALEQAISDYLLKE